jgi:hypothetical protein
MGRRVVDPTLALNVTKMLPTTKKGCRPRDINPLGSDNELAHRIAKIENMPTVRLK